MVLKANQRFPSVWLQPPETIQAQLNSVVAAPALNFPLQLQHINTLDILLNSFDLESIKHNENTTAIRYLIKILVKEKFIYLILIRIHDLYKNFT